MELNGRTRVKELLETYPELKARITEINPKFALLHSPMAKLMLGRVTLADVCERSGMSMEALVAGIRRIIEPAGEGEEGDSAP